MVQWYKFVLFYLWIAPHVLLVIVSVLMYVRRLHRKYPLFFSYTIYEVIVFLALFTAHLWGHGWNGRYRYLFLVTALGSTVLRFGIIQELFINALYDYPRLMRIASTFMRWSTLVLLGAAILLAAYSPGTVSDHLLRGVALLDRSVVIIQAGLLLMLFVFSSMLGLSWRSFAFGIALGFGVYASTELAVSALRLTELSEHAKDLLDLLPTGSYHITVLVWIGYLRLREKSLSTPAFMVPELDRWSRELERPR